MSVILSITLAGYRMFLSPLLHRGLLVPSGCRFTPTCSAYGARAVRQYGLWRGTVLLLKRLARCHPWGPCGYDPVP